MEEEEKQILNDFRETENQTFEEGGYWVQKEESTKQIDAQGITGMVLGIISIFFLGIVLGTIGLVFSIRSRKNEKNGFNTAGMVCSIVGISLNAFVIILYATFFAAIISSM